MTPYKTGGYDLTMQDGFFTIPTYIFLKLEQRRKLEALVRDQGVDLPTLLTDLLVGHLDTLPEAPPPPVADDSSQREGLLRQRRGELQRLRSRLAVTGAEPPAWMAHYIADLEAEIARLERGA